MIKIKAKYNCMACGYKAGDILNAKKDNDCFLFCDSHGHDRMRHIDEFTIVDEPVIEVGSEWVSYSGVDWVVAYVGKYIVIKRGDMELCVGSEKFRQRWTPKPKTVTMYFYRQHTERLFASEFAPNFTETLFTREIELP